MRITENLRCNGCLHTAPRLDLKMLEYWFIIWLQTSLGFYKISNEPFDKKQSWTSVKIGAFKTVIGSLHDKWIVGVSFPFSLLISNIFLAAALLFNVLKSLGLWCIALSHVPLKKTLGFYCIWHMFCTFRSQAFGATDDGDSRLAWLSWRGCAGLKAALAPAKERYFPDVRSSSPEHEEEGKEEVKVRNGLKAVDQPEQPPLAGFSGCEQKYARAWETFCVYQFQDCVTENASSETV